MGINELLNIGSKMKKIRIANKLSQKEMAAKLKLSASTYSNYENEHREPPEDIIRKFCDVLEISLAELLGLGTIAKQGLDILNQAKQQTNFLNYLHSLGYEFIDGSLYNAPDPEVGMLHIKETGIDIPLTNDEFDKLENSIINNIELEIYRLTKEKGL